MAKIGRPNEYTKEIGDLICKRLASGKSLRAICRLKSMPSRQTVYTWLAQNKEFLDQYESCRNVGYDEIFDELEEIADISDKKESPMRSRLRVDTRKWYLSKVLPKKFGDKIDVTSDGKPIPILGGISLKKDEEPVE